jgi:hypothetical protein
VDEDNCMLYETYSTRPTGAGFVAACGAVFNLTSSKPRPTGWTSADAAGLPIFPLLVRYDEVMAGEIKHAIRMTVPISRRAFSPPATHFASLETGEDLPGYAIRLCRGDVSDASGRMGMRIRLKTSFNCDTLAFEASVICRALQQYGAIVADNGAKWYLSGESVRRFSFPCLNFASDSVLCYWGRMRGGTPRP